jgi:hypothetical protein
LTESSTHRRIDGAVQERLQTTDAMLLSCSMTLQAQFL